MQKGKTINELKLGDTASFTKIITEEDVNLFAKISGDHNPVHLDEAYASTTLFQTRIAHGMLVASLFSTVLGTELPGPGSIYLGQDAKFVKPVKLNDTITATVSVSEIMLEKNRILLETIAYNQLGEIVVKGVATIMPPKV